MQEPGAIVPSTVTRREANLRVRELIEQLAADASSREWAFFCECGDPSCTETIRLEPDVFDTLIAGPEGRVLSQRHHDEHGRRATGLARDLHEPAAALQRQARQQQRRAEAARRQSVAFVAHLSTGELLDAADDLACIVDHSDDLDLCPATLDLLFAFDEAISAAGDRG